MFLHRVVSRALLLGGSRILLLLLDQGDALVEGFCFLLVKVVLYLILHRHIIVNLLARCDILG